MRDDHIRFRGSSPEVSYTEATKRKSYRRDIQRDMTYLSSDRGFLSSDKLMKKWFTGWLTMGGIASLKRICAVNLSPERDIQPLQWSYNKGVPLHYKERLPNAKLKTELMSRFKNHQDDDNSIKFTKEELDTYQLQDVRMHHYILNDDKEKNGYFTPVVEPPQKLEINALLIKCLTDNALADVELFINNIGVAKLYSQSVVSIAASFFPYGPITVGVITKLIAGTAEKVIQSFWIRNKPFIAYNLSNMFLNILKEKQDHDTPKGVLDTPKEALEPVQYFTLDKRTCSQPTLVETLHTYMLGNYAFSKPSKIKLFDFMEENKLFYMCHKQGTTTQFYVKKSVDEGKRHYKIHLEKIVEVVGEEPDLDDSMCLEVIHGKMSYKFDNVKYENVQSNDSLPFVQSEIYKPEDAVPVVQDAVPVVQGIAITEG